MKWNVHDLIKRAAATAVVGAMALSLCAPALAAASPQALFPNIPSLNTPNEGGFSLDDGNITVEVLANGSQTVTVGSNSPVTVLSGSAVVITQSNSATPLKNTITIESKASTAVTAKIALKGVNIDAGSTTTALKVENLVGAFPVELTLEGENTLHGQYGIENTGDLTLKGTGTLNVSGTEKGIDVKSNLTIEDCTVKASGLVGMEAGMVTGTGITINGGTIVASGTGKSTGSGAVITAGNGIYSHGDLVINGSEVTASGKSIAILASGDVEISNGAIVKANINEDGTAGGGFGISGGDYKTVTVSDSTVTAYGTHAGITSLTVHSGTVTAVGGGNGSMNGGYGIMGTLIMDGGEVNAIAADPTSTKIQYHDGIDGVHGGMKISGGTLNASGSNSGIWGGTDLGCEGITISGDAVVNANVDTNDGYFGIYCNYPLSISGNAKVTTKNLGGSLNNAKATVTENAKVILTQETTKDELDKVMDCSGLSTKGSITYTDAEQGEQVIPGSQPSIDPDPGKDDPGKVVKSSLAVTNGKVTKLNDVDVTEDTELETISYGTAVTLKADAAAEGKRFKGWTGFPDDVKFLNDTSAATETVTFRMPAENVAVTAEYENKPTVTPDPDPSDPNPGQPGTGTDPKPSEPGTGTDPEPKPDPDPTPDPDPDPDPEPDPIPDDEPVVISEGETIATGIALTAAGGAALVGGYFLTTELILNHLLPEGAAIPTNRAQLALLVWQAAGSPEPAAVPAFADITDTATAKAAQWCVEQGYLKAKEDGTFDANGWTPRFQILQVWNKAFPQ